LLDAFGRHREGDDHALEFGTHNTAPDSRYDYLLLLSGTPGGKWKRSIAGGGCARSNPRLVG
ncbi:MAG: hypothetical protein ACR2I7_07870, partial [Geodermatophilaceae bacterium]